mgnify:CR=1 FL=1|jgi:hypothetical protein
MQIKQDYKYKGPDGKLLSGSLNLEFREIDRCRTNDRKLFYKAMNVMTLTTSGEASFNMAAIENMGTDFIDGLVIMDEEFDKSAFALMKVDLIAVFKLNLQLFEKVIAPFLTANL